jgi:hypothetical protein
MGDIAFAIPILPDKVEADREMFVELEGPRRAEYEDARRKAGFTRETVWHQETPSGTVAVVHVEAEDVGAAMMAIATSDEPFDQWFRERILDIHGVDLAEPAPPPQQVFDSRF